MTLPVLYDPRKPRDVIIDRSPPQAVPVAYFSDPTVETGLVLDLRTLGPA